MKKYFENVQTMEELKNTYRKLVFKLNPDKGGNVEEFQSMQNQYEELFKILQSKTTNKDEKNENINSFKDIINALVKYDTISIYVLNTWLWVEGVKFEDKEIQDTLKSFGARYQKKSKKWYWFEGIKESEKHGKYKTLSWAEKTSKFGCKQVQKGKKKDEPKKLK